MFNVFISVVLFCHISSLLLLLDGCLVLSYVWCPINEFQMTIILV
ncbi:hypothetical protein BCEN4_740082 [Burkholderia cenocepacia]|nr:hypothetical protein BCEN4_740082 [Burkholderia cenocepacia]